MSMPPMEIGIILIDAMFVIQLLPTDLPLKFGDLAEHILKRVSGHQAREIHFVCDSYVKSIKVVEH